MGIREEMEKLPTIGSSIYPTGWTINEEMVSKKRVLSILDQWERVAEDVSIPLSDAKLWGIVLEERGVKPGDTVLILRRKDERPEM